MIVVSAFEPPTVVAGLDDVAVMGQPAKQRGYHLGVAEHAEPFAESKIGGDNYGGVLVERPRKGAASSRDLLTANWLVDRRCAPPLRIRPPIDHRYRVNERGSS